MARRSFQGNRAIITGASSGIGRALALQLAHRGARLVVTARREHRLRELVEQIRHEGGQAEMVVGDITDPSVRERTLYVAQITFGGLDTLVNNAGIGAMGPFDEARPERLREIMEVNFFAAAELIRGALPALKQGTDPIIVNISSVLGRRGAPYCSEYCASKFALHGFSEAIRAELNRTGIDVLVVSPGTTETEFFDSLIERTARPAWPDHKPLPADRVARRILRAMQRGKHESIPDGWGRFFCWLNRFSPRLVDWIMAQYV
ncbi:MAG TPA: SDR family oxidoreductase [Planctomycetaceae bacterium]|nr:SDR family oxidoreductase [Planctomycetaceae bacterium]